MGKGERRKEGGEEREKREKGEKARSKGGRGEREGEGEREGGREGRGIKSILTLVQIPHTPVMVRVFCVVICVFLPVAHVDAYACTW